MVSDLVERICCTGRSAPPGSSRRSPSIELNLLGATVRRRTVYMTPCGNVKGVRRISSRANFFGQTDHYSSGTPLPSVSRSVRRIARAAGRAW